jgi:hypothetical protein
MLDKRTKKGRELALRLNRDTAVKATRFFIMADDYCSSYRVWQSGSPGDVFDVVPYEGNDVLFSWWKLHPSMFVFGDPEDVV